MPVRTPVLFNISSRTIVNKSPQKTDDYMDVEGTITWK